MYPCPCCGSLTLEEAPGSYEICGVCGWEDDHAQLRWPTLAGGADAVSLIQAQRLLMKRTAVNGPPGEREWTAADHTRSTREPDWRPIDEDVDDFETKDDVQGTWPADMTTLYWWRPTYWRRA
ncbi:CPCC family cysteine-rich protein [Microbacteriaceae bacterium 4G12]